METGRLWDEAASGEGVRPLWSRTPSISMLQGGVPAPATPKRNRMPRNGIPNLPEILAFHPSSVQCNVLRCPTVNGFVPLLLYHICSGYVRVLSSGHDSCEITGRNVDGAAWIIRMVEAGMNLRVKDVVAVMMTRQGSGMKEKAERPQKRRMSISHQLLLYH